MREPQQEEIAQWDLLTCEEGVKREIFKNLQEILTKMRDAIKEEVEQDG